MLDIAGSIASIISLFCYFCTLSLKTCLALSIALVFIGGTGWYILSPCSAYNSCIKEGKKHRNHGAFQSAIKAFERAIDYNHNSSLAYSFRALCYFDLNDYPNALRDFDKAIRIKPNYGEHYYNRGIVYYEKGDYSRAITDFEKAFRKSKNEDIKGKSMKNIEDINNKAERA